MRLAATPEAGPPDAVRVASGKVAWNLVLPLALGYLLLLLDRTAIGFHARQVGTELGLTPAEVGLTTPILFLGVLLFEVPSALAAGRAGAQRWLTAMLVVWGAASLATAFAPGPVTFYVARCVASVAQAGYLPTALFLVAGFTPASFRTRMFAWLVLTGLLASLLAPVLTLGTQTVDATAGLTAWRWWFVGLGAAALVLAGVVAWRLPDRPEAARWLGPAEQDALAWARSVEPRQPRRSTLEALLDPRLLVLAVINFILALSSFAAGTWYGALMRDPRAPRETVQALFVVAIVGITLYWARRVDRNGRLAPGLVIALAVSTVAYAAGVFRGPVVTKLVGLGGHAATLSAANAMIWSVASRIATLGGGGAAAFAVIDMTGLVASFVAPRVVAGLAQGAQSLQVGLLALIVALVIATGLAALLRALSQRD